MRRSNGCAAVRRRCATATRSSAGSARSSRRNEPDVLEALLDAGATEMRFGDDLPPTITNFVREPGDDELVMLACRRTTFEWVLRRMALDEGNVTFEGGRAVVGLVASDDAPPIVTRCPARRRDHGRQRHRRGRGRTALGPSRLARANSASTLPDEEVEDTGIVYFSRFFRLRDGEDYPPRSGLIGGDLGYVKYGVFVGDNRTFSLTLAAPTADEELRKTLADPDQVRQRRPRTRRRRTVPRRPGRAARRRRPRDGRAPQPLARLRRRRRAGRPRRDRRSATPRCARTRSTAVVAAPVTGGRSCSPTRSSATTTSAPSRSTTTRRCAARSCRGTDRR